jgi:hypothetical protein
MFGWIESVIAAIWDGVTDGVKAFVHFLVRGLYGYLHTLFALEWDAWSFFWQMANILANGMRGLANGLYNFGYRVIHGFIPWLNSLILWVYHAAIGFAQTILDTLSRYIGDVLNWARAAIDGVIRWIISNVYDPLARFISTALTWIERIGNVMWNYFTHPLALAMLLLDPLLTLLEQFAWDIASRLGKFFLSLIVRNLVQFVTLIENVIDAVL